MAITRTVKRLVRFPDPPPQYDRFFFADVLNQLNQFAARVDRPIDQGWSLGTYTERKTVPDAASITLEQLADVVMTYLQVNLDKGRLAP